MQNILNIIILSSPENTNISSSFHLYEYQLYVFQLPSYEHLILFHVAIDSRYPSEEHKTSEKEMKKFNKCNEPIYDFKLEQSFLERNLGNI